MYKEAQECNTHLEAGRPRESLLPPPPAHSDNILSLIQSYKGANVDPLQWYYEHTFIVPVCHGKLNFCFIPMALGVDL